MIRSVARREPEWRLEDVALMHAAVEQAEKDNEPLSYGIPVSAAYDSETDPNNADAKFFLEVYSYTDHAAQRVRAVQRELEAKHGQHATDDRVFFVKQVPNPKRLPAGV